MLQNGSKQGKEGAEAFSSVEQTLFVEIYKDYCEIITRKGNTAAINEVREVAWQNIADSDTEDHSVFQYNTMLYKSHIERTK